MNKRQKKKQAKKADEFITWCKETSNAAEYAYNSIKGLLDSVSILQSILPVYDTSNLESFSVDQNEVYEAMKNGS